MKAIFLLHTLLIFSFSFGYAAADKYITRAGSNAITLGIGDKPVGFYQINDIITDNPNFSISAINSCQFIEKQCIIDIDVAAEAASQSANLTYQLTDLLTGQLSQESITLETAPVMNHISSANAYYDYSTEHYLVARGNQVTFDIEVIGGFPWVDADISISNTEAIEILEHNCTGTIEVNQSCQVIARVSDTTEALYADLNIINSFPSQKTLEIEHGLGLQSRVKRLSTGMLKIDFIALQTINRVNISNLHNNKWIVDANHQGSCNLDPMTKEFTLSQGEECSVYLLQHAIYRYFTTGLYQKEITIPTSVGDFSMEVNLEGQLAIPDHETNHLFMYKVNGYEVSFDREIPLSVPIEGMLSSSLGYLYITDADNGDIYRYNLLYDNLKKVYTSTHGVSSLILRENIFLNNAQNLHVVYKDGTLLQLRESLNLADLIVSTYDLGYADNFYHISKRSNLDTLYLTKGNMNENTIIQTINLTSPLTNTTGDVLATNLESNTAIFRINSRVFVIDSSNTPFYRNDSVVEQWTDGKATNSLSVLARDIQVVSENINNTDVIMSPGANGGIGFARENGSRLLHLKPSDREGVLGDTLGILPSDNAKFFAVSNSEATSAIYVGRCLSYGCQSGNLYRSIDDFRMPNDINYEAMTVVQFLSATELRPIINQ